VYFGFDLIDEGVLTHQPIDDWQRSTSSLAHEFCRRSSGESSDTAPNAFKLSVLITRGRQLLVAKGAEWSVADERSLSVH